MANLPIGYYVHHHGSGHMMRALAIARAMTSPVIIFSTREPYEPLPPHATFVKLPDDAIGGYDMPPIGGSFLYTPYDPIVLDRYRLLLDSIRSYGIQIMHVDVSPEIAVFCKLLGLRVSVAVMHGVRTDPAHTFAYNSADVLLCHNAKIFDTPENRDSYTPVHYSGGISRLGKRHLPLPDSIRKVLVATSRVGSSITEQAILDTAAQFSHIEWEVVGAIKNTATKAANVVFHGVVEDLLPLYDRADMVIGSGGNNTIMEVASQRKPFVCIPDKKAFSEQTEAAKALTRLDAAFYEPAWPSTDRLRNIFSEYKTLDLDTFYNLVDDTAAQRAARIIQTLA